MGKIIKEYETEYNVGDVVIFKRNDAVLVGIVEGYYLDNNNFWFNIRITPNFVYTYSNGGDVAEWDILAVVNGDARDKCWKYIAGD